MVDPQVSLGLIIQVHKEICNFMSNFSSILISFPSWLDAQYLTCGPFHSRQNNGPGWTMANQLPKMLHMATILISPRRHRYILAPVIHVLLYFMWRLSVSVRLTAPCLLVAFTWMDYRGGFYVASGGLTSAFPYNDIWRYDMQVPGQWMLLHYSNAVSPNFSAPGEPGPLMSGTTMFVADTVYMCAMTLVVWIQLGTLTEMFFFKLRWDKCLWRPLGYELLVLHR